MKPVSFVRTSPQALGEAPSSEGYTNPLSLDELFVTHPTSTFFVRVGSGSEAAFPVVESEPGLEVHSGDLLIIDRAVAPSIGRLVLVATEGELVLRRFTEHEGKRYVVGGEGKVLPLEGDGEVVCWGVVKAVVRNV